MALFSPAVQADAVTLDYGTLSRKYETSGDPTDADPAWGYGAYQMLSDTAYEYADWLAGKSNATYKSWGKGLQAAHKKDKKGSNVNFNAMWRYVAGVSLKTLSSSDRKRVNAILKKTAVKAGSRKKALVVQYDFTYERYYKPALKYWKKVAPGFNDKSYTLALRSVLFSCAVAAGPYGSAYNILEPTLKTLGGWKKGLDEKKLINALYNERSKVVSKAPGSPAHKITKKDKNATKYKLVGKYLKHYYSSSGAVQVAIYKRFHYDEKQDALKLLTTCKNCKHAKAEGGKVTKYLDVTDAAHKEVRTAKVCPTCGKTLEKAGTYEVDNVYVMDGTSYRDASGRDYTVHKKGYYKVSASGLSLRKSAAASAGAVVKLSKGAVIKVTKAKLAEDGFWWGRAKRSKKTGWVRMGSLGTMGTASAHSFKKDVCTYCGLTKTQEKAMAKIRAAVKKGAANCAFTKEETSYKVAYESKSMVSKTHAKGSTVKVKKVVKNRFNDWWAVLSDGKYVDLRHLKLL